MENPIVNTFLQDHDCLDHVLGLFYHLSHLINIAQVCTVFREKARELFISRFDKKWFFLRNQVYDKNTVTNMFREFGDLIHELEVDENYFEWDGKELPFDKLIIRYCTPRMGNHQNLVKLKLENLTQPNVTHLVAALPNLQIFELRFCSQIPKDLLSVIMQYCSELRELSVTMCSGSFRDNFPLKNMFKPNFNLIKLHFRRNENIDSIQVVEFLRLIPNLKELSIYNNDFEYEQEDFTLNLRNFKFLKSLNKLELNCGHSLITPLFTTLKENANILQLLKLKLGRFGPTGFYELLKVNTILSLQLIKCRDITGIDPLEMTRELTNIEDLVLSFTPNNLTNSTILYLVKYMAKLKRLQINLNHFIPHTFTSDLIRAVSTRNGVIQVEINSYDDLTETTIYVSRDDNGEVHNYEYENHI